MGDAPGNFSSRICLSLSASWGPGVPKNRLANLLAELEDFRRGIRPVHDGVRPGKLELQRKSGVNMNGYHVRTRAGIHNNAILVGNLEAWSDIEKQAKAEVNSSVAQWIAGVLKPYGIVGGQVDITKHEGGCRGQGVILRSLVSGVHFAQLVTNHRVFLLMGVSVASLLDDVQPIFTQFELMPDRIESAPQLEIWLDKYKDEWGRRPFDTSSGPGSQRATPTSRMAALSPAVSRLC